MLHPIHDFNLLFPFTAFSPADHEEEGAEEGAEEGVEEGVEEGAEEGAQEGAEEGAQERVEEREGDNPPVEGQDSPMTR